MVRRQASSASDEGLSQSQQSVLSNIGNGKGKGVKVKAEKVKMEKVKEKMREQRESRRTRMEEVPDEDDQRSRPNNNNEQEQDDTEGEDDDEQDADGDEDGDEEDGSTKSRKRVRVDDDGEARAVRPERVAKTRIKTLPRDTDGYVPGSIMRVQLRNFVTYDWTEFHAGPALNMILGPNGTGKSSIACAICLGLNWPPSVLGRATELNSFVKIGATDGHIEIELKSLPGKPNLIIKRTLSSTSKGSTFTLNGSPATGAEIKARMAQLNVQVGNLCSFLPQDKVSEFAQMSSVQLLKETQRAAGDENLTIWHQTLIESGRELRGIQELVEAERDKLKVMVDRNNGLMKEVERVQVREKIEKRIEELELLIPNQEFLEAKVRYYAAKDTQRALHEKVKLLREKNKPAHDLLDKYAASHTKLLKTRDDAKKKVMGTFQKIRNKWSESDKLEKEAEELHDKLHAAKETDKKRLTRIKASEAHIAKLQHELENPPETEDLEKIMDEFKRLNEGRAEKRENFQELQARVRETGDASARETAVVEKCNADLKKLADVGHRKLQALRQWDQDTFDAVTWLRQNQGQFKQPIIEPPMLCLTIPDKRFVNAVEACFNANQLKMLVAQNQEDYDKLNHIVNDSGTVLRKGGRVNTWFRSTAAPIPGPPMSPDEMQQLGFQGYALDFVECPEGLKWFLQRDLQLHRTAIGLDARRVNTDHATQAVSRNGGATFIAGNVINHVRRSRYGKKAAQNTTGDVRPARNFAGSSIDPAEQQRIDNRIKEAKIALSVIEQEMATITQELADSRKEEAQYKAQHTALTDRKQIVLKIQGRQKTLGVQIVTEQDKLRNIRAEPSAEAKATKLKQDILKLTRQRLKIAKGYTELMRSVIRDQADMTRVSLEFVQVGANKVALETLCKESDAEANKALLEFEAAHAVFEAAKIASRDTLRISRAAIANASDDLRDRYKILEQEGTFQNKTSDELKGDLETEKNNLELNRGANPGVVEQYQKRKREIEALTETLSTRERNAEKIDRAIKHARDNWEPALEALVTSIGKKFTAAFDRIGCAGEIRISRHEDFDKWAIDILVKFRDKEKLQLLTGQRQSGGERSLTTILYLMSLTEEARSPFSLVDEINQGMDMRAERAVHNSMVEVTCKPDSGQYFLITPKLLPDLNYHERMKVLCVNNGEWLPEESHLGNMMGMVESCAQRRNPNMG